MRYNYDNYDYDKEFFYKKIKKLSANEKKVLKLIIKGGKPKTISEVFSRSPKTITTYTNRIKNKMCINSLTELCYLYGLHQINIDILEEKTC